MHGSRRCQYCVAKMVQVLYHLNMSVSAAGALKLPRGQRRRVNLTYG